MREVYVYRRGKQVKLTARPSRLLLRDSDGELFDRILSKVTKKIEDITRIRVIEEDDQLLLLLKGLTGPALVDTLDAKMDYLSDDENVGPFDATTFFEQHTDGSRTEWTETGRLFIGFNHQATPEQRQDALQHTGVANSTQYAAPLAIYSLKINDRRRIVDLANELHELPGVIFCEPDFIEDYVPSPEADTSNNYTDPSIPSDEAVSWPHRRIGTYPARNGGSTIESYRTHKRTPPRVAIIDAGFSPHQALPIETEGFVEIANEGQYSFRVGHHNFGGSHGTACAGVIRTSADQTNDGPWGVSPDAILSLLCAYQSSRETQGSIAMALLYAASHANVISCSLGYPAVTTTKLWSVLDVVLTYIHRTANEGRGIPVFFATSHRRDALVATDEWASHPAVIAVGSVDYADQVCRSAFGNNLDLVAPGENIYVLGSNNGKDRTSGTSYAAPCVAGVAALLLGIEPRLSAYTLRDILIRTAKKIDDAGQAVVTGNRYYRSQRYGYGRVDASAAVTELLKISQPAFT